MNTITAPVSLAKAPAPRPLATGTLYEVLAEQIRVGDTVIHGNCVRIVVEVLGPFREWENDGDWVHRITVTTLVRTGRLTWTLAHGRPMMVLRQPGA